MTKTPSSLTLRREQDWVAPRAHAGWHADRSALAPTIVAPSLGRTAVSRRENRLLADYRSSLRSRDLASYSKPCRCSWLSILGAHGDDDAYHVDVESTMSSNLWNECSKFSANKTTKHWPTLTIQRGESKWVSFLHQAPDDSDNARYGLQLKGA